MHATTNSTAGTAAATAADTAAATAADTAAATAAGTAAATAADITAAAAAGTAAAADTAAAAAAGTAVATAAGTAAAATSLALFGRNTIGVYVCPGPSHYNTQQVCWIALDNWFNIPLMCSTTEFGILSQFS